MIQIRIWLTLVTVLVFGASCGTIALRQQLDSGDSESFSAALNTVLLRDAEAALALAQANDDFVSAPCWATIADYARLREKEGQQPAQPSTGALLAIQRARNVIAKVQDRSMSKVQAGCAALVQDMIRQGVSLAARMRGM